MGAFEYVAIDGTGRERKGVIEGDTPRHVRQLLRDQSLLPVAVTEVQEKAAASARQPLRLGLRRGLSAADLALVTRQLATLVKSALPLEEALLAAEAAELLRQGLAVVLPNERLDAAAEPAGEDDGVTGFRGHSLIVARRHG